MVFENILVNSLYSNNSRFKCTFESTARHTEELNKNVKHPQCNSHFVNKIQVRCKVFDN